MLEPIQPLASHSSPTLAANPFPLRIEKSIEPTPFLSSRLDLALIGGLSLIAFAFLWFFTTENTIERVATTAVWLSVVVNWPHFTASYKLLYMDYRSYIWKKFSFFSVAVLVPCILLAVVGYGVLKNESQVFLNLLRGMFILVSWHYIKQIFGTLVMSFARDRNRMTLWERRWLKTNLYMLGLFGWVGGNTETRAFEYFGVNYAPLNLQRGWMVLACTAVVVSLIGLMACFFRNYLASGRRPPALAVASFVAIYVWTIPIFYHPAFFLIIPLFHSLQYYLFVFAYRKNQFQEETASEKSGEKRRSLFFKKLWGGYALEVLTGAMIFYLIPKVMDEAFLPSSQFLGLQMWTFIFTVFINIHHYFIDAAIWRGHNTSVRRYLMNLSQ